MANDVLPRVRGYNDFTGGETGTGLALEFTTDGKTVESNFQIPASMAGWRTVKMVAAHPGAIDTVLSTIMGRAAIFQTKQAALLKSFQVEYFDFLPVDAPARATSVVSGIRGSEAVCAASITDANGVLIARASGAFFLFTTDELAAPPASFAGLAAARCDPAFLQQFANIL